MEEMSILLRQVNRGGLCTATDLIYQSCLFNWNLHKTPNAQGSLLEEVYAQKKKKTDRYVSLVMSIVVEGEQSSNIVHTQCKIRHSFSKIFYQVSERVPKNFSSVLNDQQRCNKQGRGFSTCMQTRMIAKLASTTN